jgi:hypothetical protein
MCPFCWSTLALAAVSASSAGGLAALALKLRRNPNEATVTIPNSEERRDEDVCNRSDKPENSIA